MKQKILKITQILLVLLLFSLVIINVYSIANQTVYITKSGSKYHRDGCQYLSSSKIAIDLDEAISKGYEPCSKCNAPTISDTSTNTTNNIATNTNTSSKQTLREHLIEQNKLEEALSYMYSDAPKSSNTSSNHTTSNSENELNHIEIIYYILIFAIIIIFIIIIIAIIKKNKGKKNEQK